MIDNPYLTIKNEGEIKKCFMFSIYLSESGLSISRNIKPVEGILKREKRNIYFYKKKKKGNGYQSTKISYLGNHNHYLKCFDNLKECEIEYFKELKILKKELINNQNIIVHNIEELEFLLKEFK